MPDLRVVDAGNDRAQWDRYVASAPLSTFCHQAAWREIMTEVLGHESFYFAAIDEGGEWRGILPLVRVRSVLGHYLISLPFLSDGGPLGDSEAQDSLVKHGVDEAKRSGASLLELRARQDVPGPVSPSNRRNLGPPRASLLRRRALEIHTAGEAPRPGSSPGQGRNEVPSRR